MAKSKETFEELRKRYGLSGNAKSASTQSGNTKQNESSASSFEELRKKYGLGSSKTTYDIYKSSNKTSTKKTTTKETSTKENSKGINPNSISKDSWVAREALGLDSSRKTANVQDKGNKLYSDTVKYLQDSYGLKGASGIMTEQEWRRRNDGGTYEEYLAGVIAKHDKGYKDRVQEIINPAPITIDTTKHELFSNPIKDLQEAHKKSPYNVKSYDVTNAEVDENKESNASGWEIAGNSIMSGLGTFNKGLFSTLDFILPTEFLGKYDFISNLNEYYSNQDNYYKQKKAESLEGKGTGAKIASDIGEAVVAAIPNAILAIMSSGTSSGASLASSGTTLAPSATTSTGVLSTVGNTAKTMVQNPLYWTSFAQTAGTDYEEAIANGADEHVAVISAIIKSGINAGIELGGIEKLPDELKGGNTKKIVNWVKSSLEEGNEEVVQGIVSASVDKIMYDQDKKVVSFTDDEAIINPQRMAKEFGMGMAVGGVLGGGQMGLGLGVNAISNKLNTPQNPIATTPQNPTTDNNHSSDFPSFEGVEYEHEETAEERNQRISELFGIDNEVAQKEAEANEAAYEAGRHNVPRESVNLATPEQEEAYNEGRKEYIRNMGDEPKTTPTVKATSTVETTPDSARKTVTEPKSTPSYETLQAMSEENEPISLDEVKKVTGFGDNGAKLATELASQDGMTFEKASNEMKVAYLSGYQGEDITFTDDLQNRAKLAGIDDRIADNNIALERAKNATVNKESGFDKTNLPSDVTKRQAEIVDLMAKGFGYKAFVKKGLKGNAEINHDTGEVAIDFDFQREYGSGNNKQKVSIVFHAAHEMALHGVVNRAPEDGKAFVYAMYKHLAGNESLLNSTLADKKRSDYAKQNVNISLAQAMEEISANNILYLYGNKEVKFQKAIENIINGNDVKAKQGLRKYIEYLTDILRKIGEFLKGKTKADRAEIQAEIDEVRKLRDMFETAVAKAVENKKAVETHTKSSENLEIKTNEDYNGNINHSLKWRTDLNRTQYAQVEKWIRQAGNPESTRITDTANWYKGRINGETLFVIYSDKSTILYERKGAEAKLELDILLEHLEDIENGRSIVDVSKDINTLLSGDWMQAKHNLANNNAGLGKRGSNTGYASVLQGKSSEFIGSQAFRNVVKNLFEIQERKSYSLKDKAPTFYSHMGKTIDGIKQDKIGANSVISYLTGRGVKAEEIKWSGIEEFLEGKKSVTKAELQEFVAGSMLQIEETVLSDEAVSNYKIDYSADEKEKLEAISENLSESWGEIDSAWQEMFGEEIAWDIRYNDNATRMVKQELNKRVGDNKDSRYEQIVSSLKDVELWESQQEQIVSIAKERTKEVVAPKWSEYKLEGGDNYREITFKMPESTYTNEAMRGHWGNVEGILAHARIQDFEVNGNKMLFIEEIQSDWHNEGQKEGYANKLTPAEEKAVADLREKQTQKHNELKEVLNAMDDISANSDLWDKATKLRKDEQAIWAEIKRLQGQGNIPDAPFRDNYHEYVLKRLIRIAAEQGYDSIGWTPSEIQSQRWSERYTEGYRIEYDQDIPKFLNKYGKKWGAKVGKTEIGKEDGGWYEVEGTEVWSMPITDSMKESVLYEGQPMYSLKDSEGNSLTEEQQEYFKDSKVKDENGNLLVMYQGASEDFTVFDRKKSSYANLYGRGFYFTNSENHASQYGNTRAYYLNIKHPVSTTETTITKAQLRKFLQAVIDNEDYSFENYGYGATLDSVLQSVYGKSDFLMLNDISQTAIGDLVETVELFNEVNGTDYDGIILATETVTFNSEQAKLTSNKKPTNNPNINFSLKEPVEETKNLVAVHNTTADKLLGALKLGGLPSPSIAITKKDVSHEKFGDISLVFRKDTISPTDRRNKIYSGDAYTPTGVRVEYDVDDDVLQNFNKRLKELTPEWTNERLPSVDAGTATAENDSLYGAYERNDRAKLAFLREKGKAPKVAMRMPRLSNFVSNDTVIALAKAFSAKQLSDIANTSEGMKQYKNAFLKVIRDNEDSRIVERGIYSADDVHPFDIEETARKAARVKENKYKIKKEVDNRKTYELIDKKFTKALKAEYRAWIDENTKDAIVDKGIRNNRDLFTPSGNRRSFKQLHEPYNLSNIIKQMFSGDDKGIALFGGSPIGAAQHEYSSIADVKADSGRIQQLEQEEYDKLRDLIESDVLELAQKMQMRSDVFAVRDLLSEAIGKKTKKQADAYLKKEAEGWAKYSPDFTNELWEIRERILNMPTEYFEAKPKRAVSFNEVALAVLPKGMTELRKQLEDAGVQKVVYYDKAKDGDRLAKVNSLPDVDFSLKETNDINYKDRKDLISIIEHLKGEFEITKFAKVDPKKLAKMTKDILKEYSSKADFDETFKEIDELYQYMANGEDGHPAVWEDVYNRAYNIAQNVLENALVVDDSMYQEYKSLRSHLRNTPMKFDSKYDSVPSAYENFQDFYRSNFGRLKFTKDGMSIDAVYQELSSLYPEFFDGTEQTDSASQLERITEVLDEMRPTEVNLYDSSEIKEGTMYLANDLTSRFFDIPQAKPTFADKAERRVVEARIAGNKKVEAVRQQRDVKIKKLIEAQREKTKTKLDKLRQQRDNKVEKEKAKRRDALAKMSESQKAKVLRARIIQHAGELNKTLLKATDKKHIPPELEKSVLALLYNINMESSYSYDVVSHSYKRNDKGLPTNKTQTFRELKEVYEQIAKNNDYGLTLASELYDLTGEGVSNIFDEVMKLSDKKIADMTSSELTKIYDAIRLVEHSITTANKMFAMQKWENLTETAKAFEKSVATRRAKHALMKRHYTLDVETPITFFSHFGEAGRELYQALRVAQDNEQVMIDELAEHIQSFVSLEDVKKADKEIYEFTTFEGKTLTLSKAHIMDIYLLYNRKQGRKHLLYDPDNEYFGNGIHQPEIKKKHIRRDAESTRLTKADLGNIISKLSEQDKAMADKMQKATLLLAEWGNKACMKVFGYEKFNDPDYWTIKSARESINQTIEKNKDLARSIKNMGSAKAIDDKATNALDIGGVFNVFNQHASDMISYSAWLEVMEDATKLYNYTFRDESGNKTSRTFDGMLEKYAGEGGSKYYFNLLKDIQNGIGTAPDTAMEQIYTSLFGKAAKAKVAFKLTVVAQQPMAIVRAANVLNPLSIIQASAKGGLNLPVWAVSKVKNIAPKQSGQLLAEWYGGWQRALKYAPIASRKAIGGYEINSNSSGLESVLYQPKTKKGKAVDALKESPLWAAGKADEVTWGILWNACEIETKRKTNLEKGSEAFYKAVAERFTNVINETQVVDGVLQRSQLMRSSSGWIKPLTTFKGEPTMALNGVIRAYDQLRYETDSKKRGKAIKTLSRTATVFVASAIFTAFARSLAVGLTGDDDEEYWEKVWKSFSGVQGDEETWFDFVANIGLKSDVVNNINPLTWLPITSELMSMAQGYDVERLDVASVSEFYKAGKAFIESLDGSGKNTVVYATRNLLLKFAELTGYSPYNLVRDIEGAVRTSRVESNDVKGLYEMEKWRTKPASNTSKYIDILYKAYSTDSEAYEYIYDDLIKSGVDAEKIQSGMETRMKKAEGVEKSSDLSKRYMSPDDEKKYDNNLNKIKSNKAWKSANAKQRKNAEADLYNILTSTSKEADEIRAKAKENGLDETEYVLWQLAKEMADKPTDKGEYGTYTGVELADALAYLDVDDDTAWDMYLSSKDYDEGRKARELGIDAELYARTDYEMYNIKADYIYQGRRVNGADLTKEERENAKLIKNSREKNVVDYLNTLDLTDREWLYLYGTEYDKVKKRSDYINYFGKE